MIWILSKYTYLTTRNMKFNLVNKSTIDENSPKKDNNMTLDDLETEGNDKNSANIDCSSQKKNIFYHSFKNIRDR